MNGKKYICSMQSEQGNASPDAKIEDQTQALEGGTEQ